MRILGFLVLCLTGVVAAAPPTLLVMGDSLSAAYGIPQESGWVRLLQQRLVQEGYPHRVINGSIAGETTAGGLARLPAALKQHAPAVVLIELGGNDGLRGLPIRELKRNLVRMVQLSRESSTKVGVFEMRIPANYGATYAGQFRDSFVAIAREQQIALIPFFLAAAVATGQFQDDGIHPTVAAQPKMLEMVWPALKPLLGPGGPAK